MRHQIGICDQHPRCILVSAKHADRFAGLNQQRFIVFKLFEAGDNLVKIIPCARCASDAAIDDQLVRVFRNVGMQIVHQHPQRCFRQPAFCVQFGAGRWINIA